jgi:uncharacterized protein
MLLALLCLFAFLAGFIDAMVGGGGLIQLPAFFILFPHLSLVQTLATNKTASFLGTSVAALKYIRNVKIDWRHLVVSIIAACIGSFSGALLVSRMHKEQFMPAIIIALVVVLIYTLFKKDFGLHHKEKLISRNKYYLYSVLLGGGIGLYDGIIGPGTGSFLIFAFVFLFGYNFLHASANAKVLNVFTNFAAITFFFAQGAIVWSLAIPMGLSNMAGNYLGSHVALKKGSAFLRVFFLIIVTILIIKLASAYL